MSKLMHNVRACTFWFLSFYISAYTTLNDLLALCYLHWWTCPCFFSDYRVKIKFFANDLKIYAEISCDVDAINLQSVLSCVSDWAKRWQLTVSIKKCCILHIGKVNTDGAPAFSIDAVALPVCNFVKDLGITVNDTLAPCDHIAKITSKVFQRVNLLFRTFTSRDVSHLFRAYCTYVRPLLELYVIWSPSKMCDIRRVESVQQKFTKRLPGYRDLRYADRRKLLELDTLEQRRLKFDLVMCYKIVFGLVKLEFLEFFVTAAVTITRGHPYRLFVNLARHNVRKTFLQSCQILELPTRRFLILVLLIVLSVILIKLIFADFLIIQ